MSDSRLQEHTVASERVFRGKLLSVRVDTVRLPDGAEATREIVEHAPAVAVVPLLPTGEVALVRQWRQPAGEVLLEIPAGVMHAGETPEECARRELAEEVGYRPGRLTPLFSVYLAPGYSEEMIHLFLAEELVPEQCEADDDEFLEVVTMSLAAAVAACRSGEIRDVKTVAGLLGATGE